MKDTLFKKAAGLGSKAPALDGSGQSAPKASQQGGGMVLPAPGGAPVTAPQGGDTSVSAESTSQWQAPAAASHQPSGNASQSVAALAGSLGLDVIHGLPLVDNGALNNKKIASATKFIGLVELGLDPGASESDATRSMCLARAFLPVDVWENYISTGSEAAHTPGATLYNVANLEKDIINWKGTNEFERKRSAEALLAAHGAEIKSMAVSLPIDVLIVRSARLRNYDSKAGGFEYFHFPKGYNTDKTLFENPLPERRIIPNGTCNNFSSNKNALYRDTFVDFPPSVLLPKIWAMNAPRAEKIINRLIDRRIYVAYTIRLREIPLMKMDYMPLKLSEASGRIPVWTELTSAAIYEDADLERLIERIPLKKSREPILLSGIPEFPGFPETLAVDDATLSLAMLRDQGDVLSDDAWHDLMIDQAKLDKEYYDRMYIERFSSGGSIYRKTADDFDRNYTPFFPNGFEAKGRTSFTEAQIQRFKEWAKLRAMHLPNELIFRAAIQNYPPGSVELQLPVVKVDKRIATGFDKALTGRGYSTNQILQPDVRPWGTGSTFNTGLLEGPGKSRRPVLVLPDIATHFAPGLSDSTIREIFEDRSHLAEFSLRTGGSEFIPINAKSEIFALHIAPMWIRIYSADGREVRFEHQYDVAAIDPNRLDVATPTVSPLAVAALPLSAETIDLLTVKYLPGYVSDKDYRRMLLARWEYEASVPPEKGEPDWGRFFVPGKPKPNAAQQAALTARFKEWTVKRAVALPEKLRLFSRHFRIEEGKPIPVFSSGIYHLAMDPLDVKDRIRTCRLEVHSHPAMAPACDYLESVRNNTPVIYPFGLGYQMAGPRIQCNSALGVGGRDTYCNARKDQFDKVGRSNIESGFRDIFIYDKEIFFPGTRSDALSLKNPGMIVDVTITGARAANAPLSVPFIEALKRYETFREGLGLGGSGYRGKNDETLASAYFIFDAKVVSARLVDSKTQKPIRNLELRVARTPDLEALALGDTSTSAPDAPFGPDIVGVRLGMTFDQAEKAIRSHMTVGRVLTRERARQSGEATGNFEKFSSSRIYVAKDESEFIILYDEPPAAQGVVIGITRQMNFAQGQMTAASALNQMRSKYGKEDWIGKKTGIGWGKGFRVTTYNDSITHQCLPVTGNLRSRNWAEEDGSQTQWRPASGHAIPNLRMYSNASGRNCGAVLSMQFDVMNSRSAADRLVLQLTDPNHYMKLFKESKRLVKSGKAVSGGIPTAQKIKF